MIDHVWAWIAMTVMSDNPISIVCFDHWTDDQFSKIMTFLNGRRRHARIAIGDAIVSYEIDSEWTVLFDRVWTNCRFLNERVLDTIGYASNSSQDTIILWSLA